LDLRFKGETAEECGLAPDGRIGQSPTCPLRLGLVNVADIENRDLTFGWDPERVLGWAPPMSAAGMTSPSATGRSPTAK
jgi:hypothetical protein